MTNEQIEKALELCRTGDEEHCSECPYSGNGCELKLVDDVLGYIKYLKSCISALSPSFGKSLDKPQAKKESDKPQEGRKLYVNENGRYAIDEWTEFHCGDGIDIFVNGEWIETSIEAVDGKYYAVGMEGKEIVGLYAKPNRGARL